MPPSLTISFSPCSSLLFGLYTKYGIDPDFLQSVGMHCVGCMAAHGESLYDACRVHGLSGAKVVRELNRIIAG